MKLAITICATSDYMYAMSAQARRIQTAVRDVKDPGYIIICHNDKLKIEKIKKLYSELLPKWEFIDLYHDLPNGKKNYKQEAQLLIAQMRTAVFSKARALDVDYCWSLDSDVLPPSEGFDCMYWSLQFDKGYYQVATCPYPSQGGGSVLGGRGTVYHPIAEDWAEDERQVPPEILKVFEETKKINEEAFKAKDLKKAEESGKILMKMYEEIKQFPPKGNVFELQGERIKNGKGWIRRGWFDQAYPGIGRGSIVPTDWCGFGCILMTRQALALAHFDGYTLEGTEDLYVCWKRWYPAGIKMNAIAHCPADHVSRNPGKPGYFVLHQMTHETEGEGVGHLRQENRPFYNFDLDEVYDEKNDGKMIHIAKAPESKEVTAKPGELVKAVEVDVLPPEHPPSPKQTAIVPIDVSYCDKAPAEAPITAEVKKPTCCMDAIDMVNDALQQLKDKN